jgi:hypothetical protein
MSNLDPERLKAADGNMELYYIVNLLDKYDLAGLGTEYPGEYISEARAVLAGRDEIRSPEDAQTLLIKIMRDAFDWKTKPIRKRKYKQVGDEIFNFIISDKHSKS